MAAVGESFAREVHVPGELELSVGDRTDDAVHANLVSLESRFGFGVRVVDFPEAQAIHFEMRVERDVVERVGPELVPLARRLPEQIQIEGADRNLRVAFDEGSIVAGFSRFRERFA